MNIVFGDFNKYVNVDQNNELIFLKFLQNNLEMEEKVVESDKKMSISSSSNVSQPRK